MTTPQVIAHRGASFETAEHTLGAYLRALDAGADGLECDVRLTADGHLVCVHDRNLRRTAASRGVVSSLDLNDLNALDFASWKNPWADLDDESDDDPELRKVLTLRRLLETAAGAGRRVELAIETKHPTRYQGLVERRLVEMLREFGWTDAGAPVRVMSFSYAALLRMRRLAPDLRVVLLMKYPGAWPRASRLVGEDWILGPGIKLLREHPRLAQRIASAGHDLHVWTVNTEEDLQLCLDLGVKAVISDKPRLMLDLLSR